MAHCGRHSSLWKVVPLNILQKMQIHQFNPTILFLLFVGKFMQTFLFKLGNKFCSNQNKYMHQNNQSSPILLQPVLKQNIVTAWVFLIISKTILCLRKMLCLHLTIIWVFLSLNSNLTSLLLIFTKLFFKIDYPWIKYGYISSVSSEKGEPIQENSEPIQLQESSKTILYNYKQHTYKKLRHEMEKNGGLKLATNVFSPDQS